MRKNIKYVKCISLFNGDSSIKCDGEIDKIYMINPGYCNENDYLVFGIPYSVAKKRFEPSTEEKYNMQENIYIINDDLSYLIPLLTKYDIT